MKRYSVRLIRTAAACMVLLTAGCSDRDGNDPLPEPDPTQVITFAPAAVTNRSITGESDAPSRSTLLTAFTTGDQMVVYGCCVPRTVSDISKPAYSQAVLPWTQKAGYSTADVFDTDDFSGIASKGALTLSVGDNGRQTYKGAPFPWWDKSDSKIPAGVDPANFRYSFFSYYPATGGFSYTPQDIANHAGTGGAPAFTFDMPSEAMSDHTKIPDAMVAATFDHVRLDGRVKLTYHHILTAIRFRVNNYSAQELTISSLTLKGDFYKSATITFDTGVIKQTTSQETSPASWQVISPDAPFKVAADASLPIGEGMGTSIMMLPNPDVVSDSQTGDCLGMRKKLEVVYTLGTGTAAETKSQTLDIFFGLQAKGGTSYALNLNFVGNEFVVLFVPVDAWENGSDNEIDIY